MKTCLVFVTIIITISYVSTSVLNKDYYDDDSDRYSLQRRYDNAPQSRRYESYEDSRNSYPWKKDESSYYADAGYDDESKYDSKYPAQEKDETDETKPIYKIEDAPELFSKFIKDYNKEYKDKEDYDKHYNNFVNKLKEINDINSSDASYSTDINLFSDLGPEELAVFG